MKSKCSDDTSLCCKRKVIIMVVVLVVVIVQFSIYDLCDLMLCLSLDEWFPTFQRFVVHLSESRISPNLDY
jgi:hypothetical protein